MGQLTQPVGELEPDTAEDLKLVADVLGKDRKATAEFVSRYTDCVYAYIRRRLMPRMDVAEDLVQEAFVAAWHSLKSYRGEATLRNWFLGIARHKVDDYYRKVLRSVDAPALDEVFSDELVIVPMFEDRMDRAAAQEKARRLLATLPEAYRIILLWRYQEEHSVREMAQLAAKTEKAIERMLARARAQFKRRWNDERT